MTTSIDDALGALIDARLAAVLPAFQAALTAALVPIAADTALLVQHLGATQSGAATATSVPVTATTPTASPTPVAAAPTVPATVAGPLPRASDRMPKPDPASWAVLSVGPDQQYPTFTQALAAAAAINNDGSGNAKPDAEIVGFTIVAPKLYPDSTFLYDIGSHQARFASAGIWPPNDGQILGPLVIDLGGNLVSTDAQHAPYYQNGWVQSSRFDLTVKNGRLAGFTRGDSDGNYRALQIGDPGGYKNSILFQDLELYGCDDGLLGGSPGTDLVLCRVFSHDNGSGSGLTHNFYVGGVDSVLVDTCVSTRAKVGHLFKSRAAKTTIINSRFGDGPDGTSSYVVNAPNGGLLSITNTLLQHGPNCSNGPIISVGEEGGSNGVGGVAWPTTIALDNVTLVDQAPATRFPIGLKNVLGASLAASGLEIFGPTAGQMSGASGSAEAIPGTTNLSTCPDLTFVQPPKEN